MKNILVAVPALLAAAVHVYIFFLETHITNPATMRTFGIKSEADAELMRPWAYNQGWYNLFLAFEAGLGAALLWSSSTVGQALLVFGCGSMLLAALILITSDRSKARAAGVQGLFPLLALLAWALTR